MECFTIWEFSGGIPTRGVPDPRPINQTKLSRQKKRIGAGHFD